MKFKIPTDKPAENYISSKIKFILDDEYNKVIAKSYIKKGEILIIEYPDINLFGEEHIDKALQIMIKYKKINENKLYPRSDCYFKSSLVKNIHKIIDNSDKKIKSQFDLIPKLEIEKLYSKYLYNTFEGWEYGPLTLPLIAKLNHSCQPNVEYNFNKINGTMIVTSIRNIKPNEEIFDSYLSNKNIPNHPEYLFEHYGFKCNCNS
jgi:hypothetical protein